MSRDAGPPRQNPFWAQDRVSHQAAAPPATALHRLLRAVRPAKSPIDVAQTSTDKPAMDETSVRKMTQVTTAYMYSRSSPIGAVGTLQTIIVA
jgi:hypothetical protein